MSTPDVSVIIPTKDRPDLLGECMSALLSSIDREVDIVVVETGETGLDFAGATQSIVSQLIEAKTAYLHRPGATFAQAVNAGVQASLASVLLLLNNDCFLTPESWRLLTTRRKLGTEIQGIRLTYPNGLIQHGGIGFDMHGNPYNLWRMAPAEHPEAVKNCYRPAVTFAAVSIPRYVWETVGGLDEHYTNCYEDIDFCLRAREFGHQTYYDGSAAATHLEGQTSGRNDHVQESWRHFAEKWITTGRLWNVLGVYPFTMGGGQ